MTVAISTRVLDDVKNYFEQLPAVAEQAAVLAVNRAVRDAEVSTRRQAYKEVAFPKGYVEGRMEITKTAKPGSTFAILSGREEPTSLARFVGGVPFEGSRGRVLSLRVAPGKTTRLVRGNGAPSAFLIKLKNGNIGLAMRLPPGESPSNAYKPKQLTQNNGETLLPLWLLYGPSVGQTMRSIYAEQAPQISADARREFFRQFARLSTRG